jgi:hypothetical protein
VLHQLATPLLPYGSRASRARLEELGCAGQCNRSHLTQAASLCASSVKDHLMSWPRSPRHLSEKAISPRERELSGSEAEVAGGGRVVSTHHHHLLVVMRRRQQLHTSLRTRWEGLFIRRSCSRHSDPERLWRRGAPLPPAWRPRLAVEWSSREEQCVWLAQVRPRSCARQSLLKRFDQTKGRGRIYWHRPDFIPPGSFKDLGIAILPNFSQRPLFPLKCFDDVALGA